MKWLGLWPVLPLLARLAIPGLAQVCVVTEDNHYVIRDEESLSALAQDCSILVGDVTINATFSNDVVLGNITSIMGTLSRISLRHSSILGISGPRAPGFFLWRSGLLATPFYA
ncbi:hypothetical protein BJY04DRAFT_56203 [Aspergillus karnatakaensis]|uniref:uncharacterized protein n=1 Tax=Aspergillus karnatakaensis TaxID=1810916 RepID=UPI003CCDF812